GKLAHGLAPPRHQFSSSRLRFPSVSQVPPATARKPDVFAEAENGLSFDVARFPPGPHCLILRVTLTEKFPGDRRENKGPDIYVSPQTDKAGKECERERAASESQEVEMLRRAARKKSGLKPLAAELAPQHVQEAT
ncbi:hypothetical protein BaRGS_00004209, partial [Batillaria attramentaria]